MARIGRILLAGVLFLLLLAVIIAVIAWPCRCLSPTPDRAVGGRMLVSVGLTVYDDAVAPYAIGLLNVVGFIWFLSLPQYSPELNPIEMAFSKLGAHLGSAAARTFEALWAALGDICDHFDPQEYWNYFRPQTMRRVTRTML